MAKAYYRNVKGQGLGISRRNVLVRQRATGAVADERHGLGREPFAKGIGGGEEAGGGAGAAAFGAGVAAGATDGEGVEAASLLAGDDPFEPAGISSLARYRKPPTPIATRQTTITASGHIQFGVAAALAGFFFNCGMDRCRPRAASPPCKHAPALECSSLPARRYRRTAPTACGNLFMHRARNADAADLGETFETRRDIDAIAKQVAIALHHVAMVMPMRKLI